MKIPADAHIVTAYAEHASGPGWSNSLVWVVWQDGDNKLHRDAFQPEEQTAEMHIMFRASEAVHCAMRSAVKAAVQKRRRRAA